MIDEAKMANPSDLSPRAAIALMSLQLRSTVREAIEAEAEADSVDSEAALWQLRSRLAPLIEDRRRALDDEVAAERERAAVQIAAAHAEADRVVTAAVAEAAARVAAEQAAARAATEAAAARLAAEAAAARAAADEAAARIAAEEAAARTAAEAVAAPVPDVAVPDADVAVPSTPLPVPTPVADTPLFDDPLIEWAPGAGDLSPPQVLRAPLTVPVPRVGRALPPPVPAPPATAAGVQPSLHVVIDAESFARAFAAAIAPALEHRQAQYQLPPQGWMPYPTPYPAPAPAPASAPAPKKSFWSHAWHPDVLLSGLAMVIVIIVLIAWTG